MAYAAIAFTIPQYENYPNYWMKAYNEGTTTPVTGAMGLDSAGAVTVAKLELNSAGFPVTTGSALVIPYIDGAYDLWLHPTEALADANDTTGAVQIANDITGVVPRIGLGAAVQELTTATMAAHTVQTYVAGDVVDTLEWATGNGISGRGRYLAVLTSGVTPNGRTIIVGTGIAANQLISFVLQIGASLNVDQLGPNGTDDSLAWQAGYDLVTTTGVKLEGTAGATYTCLTVQTCQSSNTSPFNYMIDYNGCTMDFSGSSLTSGNLITIGATSQANGHDKESIYVGNLDLIGPEGALNAAPTAADGTTVGIFFNYALNVVRENFTIRRCFKGLHDDFIFPCSSRSIKIRECYIAFNIANDCTLNTWIDCGATDCRYPMLIQPRLIAGIILNQTFINFRSEGNEGPIHIDPEIDGGGGSGFGARGIHFINPYFENNDSDYVRQGIAFALSTPGTRGADRTRGVINCNILDGEWSTSAGWTGSKAPLCVSTSGSVKSGTYRIPAAFSEVVGVLNKYRYTPQIEPFVGTGGDVKDLVSNEGFVIFAGATGTISTVSGNCTAAGVTRISTGIYTIALTEAYSGANSYIAHGSCDIGFVTMDTASSTSTLARINCYDLSATNVLFDPSRVRVMIDGIIT